MLPQLSSFASAAEGIITIARTGIIPSKDLNEYRIMVCSFTRFSAIAQ